MRFSTLKIVDVAAFFLVPCFVSALTVNNGLVKFALLGTPFFLLLTYFILAGKTVVHRSMAMSFISVWVVLTVVCILRTSFYFSSTSLYLSAYLILVYGAVLCIFSAGGRSIVFIWRGVQYFVILNSLLLMLGFSNSGEYINDGEFGRAIVLSMMGFEAERRLPYFASSFQSYSVVLGLCFLFSFLYKFSERKYLNSFVVACCIHQLLVTDTRGAVLYLLVAVCGGLSLFFFTNRRCGGDFFRIALFWSSILLSPVLYLLNQMATGSKFSEVSRGSANLLSNRDVIWESAVHYMLMNPNEFLFGLGYGGHKTSGVMSYYEDLFSNWSVGADTIITLHNTWLQLFFDLGILGVTVTLVIIWRGFNTIGDYAIFLFSSFLFLVLYGSSDVMFSSYNMIGVMFFMLLSSLAVVTSWRYKR